MKISITPLKKIYTACSRKTIRLFLLNNDGVPQWDTDVLPTITQYYNDKYLNLVKSSATSLTDVQPKFLSSFRKKQQLFLESLDKARLSLVNPICQFKVDTFIGSSGKAQLTIREEVKFNYLVKEIGLFDTINAHYITYFELKLQKEGSKWVIADENYMEDDPLAPLYEPQVSSEKFDSAVIAPRAAPQNFDRTNAVKYAFAHFNNPNPAYCDYEQERGDCTNFVSQCLSEGGGWFMSEDWRAQGKSCCSNFLACDIENCYTCTWTVADIFFRWLPKSNRVAPYSTSLSDLQPGDILEQDFDKDGRVDHSMLITESQGGVLFATYRSARTGSARMNAPVAQIRGLLYGFKVKDSF